MTISMTRRLIALFAVGTALAVASCTSVTPQAEPAKLEVDASRMPKAQWNDEFVVETFRFGKVRAPDGVIELKPVARQPAVFLNVVPVDRLSVLPKARRFNMPVYPGQLSSRNISGKALVAFAVGADGAVTEAKVIEATDVAFGDASMKAVKTSKYRPGEQSGAAVPTVLVQLFTFRIGSDESAKAIQKLLESEKEKR